MLFEKRIQYINRYREIAIEFSKYGFGYIIHELGLDEVLSLPKRVLLKRPKEIGEKKRSERMRHLLEDLGPTFTKFGQIASTRPDIFDNETIEELKQLQEHVKPMSFETVTSRIEQSLDIKINDIFTELEATPIGAASIGQVHRGILKTGQSVAVKVQRPNIEKVIRNDLEILHHLATLADKRMAIAKQYQIKSMVEEFSKSIISELDYTIEGRNQDRIKKMFETHSEIVIPEIFWELSTKEVLIMEYIEGTNINEIDTLEAEGHDLIHLAEVLTESLFKQILIEGFFHGDPHPGNIKITKYSEICFLDFGMVGRLTEEMKNHLGQLIIALMRKDTEAVVRAITKMGAVPDDVNITELRQDAEMLRDKYMDVPLNQLEISDAVDDMFNIANKHKIIMPSDFTILGKSLLTLETIVTTLNTNFSIIDVAEPFGRELLKERLSPTHVKDSALRHYYHISDNIEDISTNVHEFTKGLKERKLPINLEIDTADKMLKRFDKLANRLSFSIILLAFSIIMVGLIVSSAISGRESLLWNIPAVEIGSIIAILLFIGMFLSILKSGRL